MITVRNLYRYPLTGAQGEELTEATVSKAGLVGDRVAVLYDSSGSGESFPRLSRVEIPALACIQARVTQSGLEVVLPNYGNFFLPEEDIESQHITVDEYGDKAECYDAGEQFSQRLREYLLIHTEKRRNIDTLNLSRVAVKSAAWQSGRLDLPATRHNRPLHIVSMSSLRAMQHLALSTNWGVDRFRSNIVVDGDLEPFAEHNWVGKCIRIGEAVVVVSKLTKRCPVPGQNPKTGEDLKDVPKLYQSLPAIGGVARHFGVYGYPVTIDSKKTTISVGDTISIDDQHLPIPLKRD